MKDLLGEVESDFEALQKRYYLIIFGEAFRLCSKHRCTFDTNGGANFANKNGDILESEEMQELIKVMFDKEGQLGLPTIWIEDGEIYGDCADFLNEGIIRKNDSL